MGCLYCGNCVIKDCDDGGLLWWKVSVIVFVLVIKSCDVLFMVLFDVF